MIFSVSPRLERIAALAIGGEFDGQYIEGQNGVTSRSYTRRDVVVSGSLPLQTGMVYRSDYILRRLTYVSSTLSETSWDFWVEAGMSESQLIQTLITNYRPIVRNQ